MAAALDGAQVDYAWAAECNASVAACGHPMRVP
jgi:hypothetical protein